MKNIINIKEIYDVNRWKFWPEYWEIPASFGEMDDAWIFDLNIYDSLREAIDFNLDNICSQLIASGYEIEKQEIKN